MPDLVCGICNKRVSEWQMATGKAAFIGLVMIHVECMADKTVQEVEQQIKQRS